MLNRIVSGNTEEVIRAKVLENTLQNKNLNSRTFYFAQVIDNIDPQNLNRIKCRIPVIDEEYYINVKKEVGDSKLPWSICMSNRLLNVPEVNSIVLIALFDTKVPHFGRMYFDVFSDFTNTEYFDKLNPEKKLLSNWELVEDIFGININSKPKSFGEFNGKESINYKVGIRGKGNNKLVLDKDNILLVQNAKDKENESSISITKNIDQNSSDLISITSKKGRAA